MQLLDLQLLLRVKPSLEEHQHDARDHEEHRDALARVGVVERAGLLLLLLFARGREHLDALSCTLATRPNHNQRCEQEQEQGQGQGTTAQHVSAALLIRGLPGKKPLGPGRRRRPLAGGLSGVTPPGGAGQGLSGGVQGQTGLRFYYALDICELCIYREVVRAGGRWSVRQHWCSVLSIGFLSFLSHRAQAS